MKKAIISICLVFICVLVYGQNCNFDFKVKTTNADCFANGIIDITITGANIDSLAIVAFADPAEVYTSTNKVTRFSNLSPGTYKIKATAFCKSVGKLSTQEKTVTITSSYKPPKISAGNLVPTPYCLTIGKLTLSIADGKKPYSVKLIDKPTAYNNTLDTIVNKGLSMSDLPHGAYSFLVTDNCGTIVSSDSIVVEKKDLNFGSTTFDLGYVFTSAGCKHIQFTTITSINNNKYELAVYIDDTTQLFGWQNVNAIKNITQNINSIYTFKEMRDNKKLTFSIREIGTSCIINTEKNLNILNPTIKKGITEGICADDSTKVSFTPQNICLPYSYSLISEKKDTIIGGGINNFNEQTVTVPNGIYTIKITGFDNSSAELKNVEVFPHLHNHPKIKLTLKELACGLFMLDIKPDSICVPYKWTLSVDGKNDAIVNDSNIFNLNSHRFFLEDGTYKITMEDRTGYVINKTVTLKSESCAETEGEMQAAETCVDRCDSTFAYKLVYMDTITPYSWKLYKSSGGIAIDSSMNISKLDTIFTSLQKSGEYYVVFTDSIKSDTISFFRRQSCKFGYKQTTDKVCDSTLVSVKLKMLCPPYKWILSKEGTPIDSALNQTDIDFDIKVINRNHELIIIDTKDTLKIPLKYDNGSISSVYKALLISCDSSLYEFKPANICYPYSWKLYDYQYSTAKNLIKSDTLIMDTDYQKIIVANDSTYTLVIESLDNRFKTQSILLDNNRRYKFDVETSYCPKSFNRGSVKLSMQSVGGPNMVKKTRIEFLSGPTIPIHTDVTLTNPSIFYPFSTDYLVNEEAIIQNGKYTFVISDTCDNVDTLSVSYEHYKKYNTSFTTKKACTGIEIYPVGKLMKGLTKVNMKFYAIAPLGVAEITPIADTGRFFLLTVPGYYKFMFGDKDKCYLDSIEYNYIDSVKIRSYGYSCENKPAPIKIYVENLPLPCKFDLISGSTIVATNTTGEFQYGNVGDNFMVRITDSCNNVYTNSFTVESIHSMNFLLGDEYVCVGNEIKIESLIYNASSYTWTYPDATIHTSSAVNIPNAKAQNSGKYILNVVPNGCPSTVLTNSKTIKVSQPKPLDIGDTVFICHNYSKRYEIKASDKDCLVKWYEIDTIFINDSYLDVVTSGIDTVIHLVAQYDTINGCYSEYKQVVFVITPLPSESFSSIENNTCYNYYPQVDFKDLSIGDTYTIYNDIDLTDTIARFKATSTINTINFPDKLKETKTYYIQSETRYGCPSTVKPFIVNVYQKPKSFGMKTPVVCDGVTPLVTLTNINTNYTYNIYDNDSLTNLISSYRVNSNITEKDIEIFEPVIDTNYYYIQHLDEHSCISDDIFPFYLTRSPYMSEATIKSGPICKGELVKLYVDSLYTNYSYSIYKDQSLTEKLMSFIPTNVKGEIETNVYLPESDYVYINMDSLTCDPDKYVEVYTHILKLPELSPDILPAYNLGRVYSQKIESDSVAVSFAIVDGELPGGYFINNSGIISGVANKSNDCIFTVGVEDVNGCINTKEFLLEGKFDTPKVFSPNGDGINDYFMKEHKVIIFDRLGQVLFEGNDGWDGTHKGNPVKSDIYFYKIFYMLEEKELTKVGYIGVEYN